MHTLEGSSFAGSQNLSKSKPRFYPKGGKSIGDKQIALCMIKS